MHKMLIFHSLRKQLIWPKLKGGAMWKLLLSNLLVHRNSTNLYTPVATGYDAICSIVSDSWQLYRPCLVVVTKSYLFFPYLEKLESLWKWKALQHFSSFECLITIFNRYHLHNLEFYGGKAWVCQKTRTASGSQSRKRRERIKVIKA